MEEYLAATARFMTDESFAKGLAYQPAPTDIFVTPFGKCGTTWMQQIVHGLRSNGDMNFGEITQATPWLEMAHDLQLDLYAPQIARPHVFKSHLGWAEIPKGGRYIVVFRDPLDAMVSLYNFMNGWFFETGAITLEEFADYYLARPDGTDYWSHAAGWWGQRDNPDVLLFAYEHMKRDLPGTVARVADFMGGYDDARIALATRQAEFGFMKAHAHQFDDNYLKRLRNPACGLPDGATSTKVNEGRSGLGKDSLPQTIRSAFEDRWSATMGAQHGVPSYAALLSKVEELRSAR